MKLAANIAGILLGLIFNVVAWNFFLHFFSMPEPPAGFTARDVPRRDDSHRLLRIGQSVDGGKLSS